MVHNKKFKKVVLLHQLKIQHYRVDIYNYLSDYLRKIGIGLQVISGGIEDGNPYLINFKHKIINLSLFTIIREINKTNPDAIIYFVNLKNLYLFPLLFYAKLKGIRLIYWGHGINLNNKNNILNWLYYLEHSISDAIILYADHLKKYVRSIHYHKTFVANNTLNTNSYNSCISRFDKTEVLRRYNISTSYNIICVGRMQKRKRIFDLVEAYRLLNSDNIGLVLVGPDSDRILKQIDGANIYKIGPLYGNEKIELLKACDVFCLPGHVGLGIVDAFYCGLPIVTEAVDHAPEIFYLRNGINGFMVPKGDIDALSKKLMLLLTDSKLRELFSKNAIETIRKEGHINRMCEGFVKALEFVFQDDFRTNCKK